MRLDIGMLTHDLKTLPDYARKVEAIGYDCLWSAETQHDPFLPLAVAATVTSKVRLGTNIATVFSRSPMITAMIAWDLQKASGGRFMLGLGSQVKAHNERRFSVKFESPVAGEFCDGMHVHPFNSPKYLREVVHPTVEAGLKKSGRTRKDFTYATATFVVVGDTASERRQQELMVKQQIAFYASTRTYQPVLDVHGWGDLTSQLHRKSVEGDWKGMTELITDEMLDTYAVTAPYDTLHDRIMERYAGLLDRTSLYQPYQPSLGDPRLPALVKQFNGEGFDGPGEREEWRSR